MAVAGVNTPVVDLTITLPTKRQDGTALAPSEIQSVTVLRNGSEWKTLPGPFNGATALCSDTSPSTGEDIYSFYVTDTAGSRSDLSLPVAVTATGKPPKAPPSAGTLSAVVKETASKSK